MLRFAKGGRVADSTGPKWLVYSIDLIEHNIRAPQGFTYELGDSGINSYFWSTNELAAFLFYKRFGLAEDDVKEYFKPKLADYDYKYGLSYSLDSTKDFKCPEGLEYRPYQKSGIEYCQLAGSVLIADSMRLGKTALSLGYINNLSDVNKVVIICPKTAKLVWQYEASQWLVSPFKVQTLSAQTKLDEDAQIYIINYDNLYLQPALRRFDYDLIIADEIHMAKNLDADRSKFLFALKGKRRLGLSGTPLANNPIDLLTALKWTSDFWKDFYIYKDKFATFSGITLTLEEAQDLARATCMLRRVQAQAFGNEPHYKRLIPIKANAYIVEDVEKEKLKFTEYAGARKRLGVHKIPIALEHIDTYSQHDKIVVFAHHREVIDCLKASLGDKAVVIYGESTDKERKEAKERFNTDERCKVFLGSIAAASMAIDLSVASHILFVECDWQNWAMEQAEERCSGKNKTEQVLIEYLVFENSLDYEMLTKIKTKNVRADKGVNVLYG